MGPNFESAATTIGRNQRLPPGLVAILDDPVALCATIGELHAHASSNSMPDRPRRGIIFRVVEEWERRAITQKLWNFFGPKAAPEQEDTFNVIVGHMHIIDDSGVSHTHARHGPKEGKSDRLALTVLDFMKIPEVVNPRQIVNFRVVKGMPRLVYQKYYDGHSLVVVQELQKNAGLLVKTAYKQK